VGVKLFYKTQRELAYAINGVIDAYWESEVSEEVLMKSISDLYSNNENKVWKSGKFTTVLKQQCGKRRLDIVERVLHMNGLLEKDVSIASSEGNQK
jgi:uncharacterized protein (TIGR04540 family)